MVLLFTTLPGRVDPETVGSCMQSPISEVVIYGCTANRYIYAQGFSDIRRVSSLPSSYLAIHYIGVGDWTSWNEGGLKGVKAPGIQLN
jgi:hypothetical protein